MSNSITVKTQHRTLRAVYNTQESYEELSVKKKLTYKIFNCSWWEYINAPYKSAIPMELF